MMNRWTPAPGRGQIEIIATKRSVWGVVCCMDYGYEEISQGCGLLGVGGVKCESIVPLSSYTILCILAPREGDTFAEGNTHFSS